MKTKTLLMFGLFTFGLILFSFSNSTKVSAATCVWTGNAGVNWNTAGSWSGCGGGVPQDGDTLTFPATVNNQNLNNNIVGLEVAQMTVLDQYNFVGNEIQIANNGIISTQFNAVNIENDIQANGNFRIEHTLGFVSYNGIIDTSTFTLTADVASDSTIFFNSQITGSGNTTLQGSGTHIISGNNTVVGNITVSELPVVIAKSSTSFGNVNNVVNFQDTSIFMLQDGITIANDFVFSDSASINNDNGANTISGDIILGTDTVIDVFSGSLDISGVASGDSFIKRGTSTLTFSGGNPNTFTGSCYIYEGTLALSKTAGNSAISSDCSIGDAAGASGTASVVANSNDQFDDSVDVTIYSDGVLDLAGNSDFFNSLSVYDGLMDVNGGDLVVLNLEMIGGTVETGVGSIGIADLISMTSSAVPATINGFLEVGAVAGGIDILSTDGALSPDGIINAEIIGSSNIFFLDGHTTFEADNSLYTGDIAVNGGILTINGDNSINNVTTSLFGTLRGNGVIGNLTMYSGSLEPGDGVGIMTVAGDMALSSSDQVIIEINGAITLGSDYDQINVTGNVNLNDANLNIMLGYTPNVGDIITIIEANSINGTFNGLSNNALTTVGDGTFRINYNATNVTLTAVDTFELFYNSFTVTPNNAAPGTPVEITLHLTSTGPTPTGTVEFFANGISLGTAVVDGSGFASITTSNLPAGTYTISAQYSGDSTFGGAIGFAAGGLTIGTLSGTGINLPINLIAFTLLIIFSSIIIFKRYGK